MNTDGLISVAVDAGCEVTEYEGHFAIRSHLDFPYCRYRSQRNGADSGSPRKG